jgi:LuxR family transcriptional regulator, quorum-sensing system regulator BjaR1
LAGLSRSLIDPLIDPCGPGLLTEREREILALTAAGYGDKAIAARLGISERTIRFHLSECERRLGAANRAHAVAVALKSGEIDVLAEPKP